MASAIVNRQINVFISSGEAQKALDRLLEKEKLLNAELAKTGDPKKITALKNELAKLEEPIDRARKKLSGELLPTFRDLEAATRKWLNEYKKTGDPEALENFRKFNAELQNAKGQINNLEGASTSLTKKGIFTAAFWANLAANGVALAISKISGFISGIVDAGLEAEKIKAIFKNTLEGLGAPDAFERIERKVKDLQKTFSFFDDTEILNVFKKLVDFGKLTEKQMNDLLPVILNFATKTGLSLEEATAQIVNALSGGRVGTELRQFGLNLKDAGTEGERLGVIMTTLKAKVDGAGEAFDKTAAGGIEDTRTQFKQLQEEIGELVLPALNTLLRGVVGVFKGIKQVVIDIGDLFKSSGDKRKDIDAATFAAQENTKKFLDGIKDKSSTDQLKEISIWLAVVNKQLEENRNNLKKDATGSHIAFFDEGERKKDLIYLTERKKLLEDAQKVLTTKDPLGIPSPGDTGGQDDKLKALLAEAEAFNKRIRDLQQQSADASLTQNQKEIADAKHKYDEIFIAYNALIKKLGKSGIKLQFDIEDIKNLESRELQGIINKQLLKTQVERENTFVETTRQSFTKTIAETEKFFSEKKQIESQRFIDGIIDKKTYENNIIALDAKSKEQQLVQTEELLKSLKIERRKAIVESADIFSEIKDQAKQDLDNGVITRKEFEQQIVDIDAQSKEQQIIIEKTFSSSIEQFTTNVTTAKKAALDKQVQDEIAVFEKRVENQKLLKELDNQTVLTTAQTRVAVARKGSNEEFKAKKDLLALQHKLEVEALEEKKKEDLKALNDEFDNELRIFNQRLELERKLQLAKIDPNDPDAAAKKQTINESFDDIKSEAEIDAAKRKSDALVKINDDFNALIKAANDKFKKQELTDQQAHDLAKINQYAGYLQQILDITETFNRLKTDKENAELERDRHNNDLKVKNLDRQLKNKRITQLQHDREVQKIERDQEKREKEIHLKQFQRQKRASIIQAIINNAQGATKTIADNGFPLAIPFLVLQAAVFAAQLATIISQKPPEFAAGGKLGGRSHASGGNAVIDGAGRKIAEVEAGEGIVNKRTMSDRGRYTATGTPSQIISRLNAMHGRSWEAGATLVPQWRTTTPQRMNFAVMKKVYADGGVFGARSRESGVGSQQPQDNTVLNNLADVVSDLKNTLDNIQQNGIIADVSLTRFEQQKARLDAIRKDAMIK